MPAMLIDIVIIEDLLIMCVTVISSNKISAILNLMLLNYAHCLVSQSVLSSIV